MKFTIGERILRKFNTPAYVLTVHTMEGDADDYHDIMYIFDPDDTDMGIDHLKLHIIALHVLLEVARTGREKYEKIEADLTQVARELGVDPYSYIDADDFELHPFDLFREETYYDNGGYPDTIYSYSLKYVDEQGVESNVEVELEEWENKLLDEIKLANSSPRSA